VTDYQKDFDRFQKDVAAHVVTVLRDDGLYRHLRCAVAGSYCMSFDVLTWPGYLCYSGDMGCYVFTRLRDMFEFFRGRTEPMIDRGYLAEKCVASDKSDGLRRFDEDLFEAAIRSDVDSFTDGWTNDEKAELLAAVEEEVLPYRHDGHVAAIQAAEAFRHDGSSVFHDFWDHRLEEYTPRFVWCCYAIPWAIQQYDSAKSESAMAVAAVDPVGEKVTE
jgi:hypothetical protein